MYRVLVGKTDGGRLLGRTTYDLVDNIEMDHIQIFTEFFEVDHLAGVTFYWRHFVRTVMNVCGL